MKSFGLALGGGGARGLAHISVLEAISDLNLRPVASARHLDRRLDQRRLATGMTVGASAAM